MFNKISFINKVISVIILFIILLILPSNQMMFLPSLLVLIVAFVTGNNRNIIISTLFFLISFILPNSFIVIVIYKIILFIFFLITIENALSSEEKRYIYSFVNNNRLLDKQKLIGRCYKNELMDTIEFDNSLIYKYALDKNERKKYKMYLKEEAVKKLKYESNYKYIVDRLRFGSYHEKVKETVVKSVWTNEDNIYFAVFVFALLLSLFMRFG